MRHSILILFSFWFVTFSYSQSDSVIYSQELFMNDCFFMSYQDFRHLKTIQKDQIDSKQNPEQLEFMTRVLEEEKVSFIKDGVKMTAATKEVWAYVQNGTFYINYKEKFYRVPVFGAISFLVAMVQVQNLGFYDPRFGTSTGSSTTTEAREFIMNFYDGNLVELKNDQVEKLFSRDKALYDEYIQLNNRNKNEQLYRYIRKFNEHNPVYFFK